MTTVEPLITAAQAKEFLVGHGYRIHLKRLYEMASASKLPSHKDGRYRYFRRSELAAWLERRMSETTNPGIPAGQG